MLDRGMQELENEVTGRFGGPETLADTCKNGTLGVAKMESRDGSWAVRRFGRTRRLTSRLPPALTTFAPVKRGRGYADNL